MRAVTGSVASSRPISLSKATAILARFTAGQTAARPDVAAFVRRASAAFDELVIFHRANRAARKHPEPYVSGNSREEVEKWKSRKRSRDDPRIGKKATHGVGVHGQDANFVEEDGNGFDNHGGEKKKQHRRKGFMEERSSLPVKEAKLLHSDRNLVEQARHHSDGVESQEDGKERRKKMKPMVEEVILHRNPTQNLDDQKDHHEKGRKKKARTASAIEAFGLEQLESNLGPAEVFELTGPEVMEDKCASAAICFVSFLPDILDSKAEGRNKYLDLLLSVAEKFKRSPYSFVWSASGKQADLENQVGVGGYGYPAMVALNVKKGAYAPLKSSFQHDQIIEFVKEAGRGGKGNLPLQNAPTIVKAEPWDGKDGEIIEEDEFSLDELMGEENRDKDEL